MLRKTSSCRQKNKKLQQKTTLKSTKPIKHHSSQIFTTKKSLTTKKPSSQHSIRSFSTLSDNNDEGVTPTSSNATLQPPRSNLRVDKRLKIKDLTSQLQAIDSPQPQREAWWIISKKSKIPERVLRLAVKNEQPNVAEPDIDVSDLLSPVQLEEVYTALDNRIRLRKPLQYVLGDVDFCKLQLNTSPGILIPRPETEQMTTWIAHQVKLYNQYVLFEKSHLDQDEVVDADGNKSDVKNVLKQNHEIEELIHQKKLFDYTEDNIATFHGKYPLHRFRFSWYDAIDDPIAVTQRVTKQTLRDQPPSALEALANELEDIKIFDLCSGSGNISLALASQFPQGNVVGVDIDRGALKLARYNKQQLNIKNTKFYHCDLFRNSISQTIPPPTELTAEEYPERSTSLYDGDNENEVKIESPKRRNLLPPNAKVSNEDDHQILEPYLGLYDLTMLSSLADIIVSNPPYIQPEQIATLDPEVKNWENHFALTPLASFYDYAGCGEPYHISDQEKATRGITDLPPWPTKEEIRQHALPFYERIIKSAPRLLTHNEHFIPRQNIKFPRLVLEIGHEEQALHVANMASYIFDVEVYLDGYDRPRWIVGFEPPGYH